MQMRAHEHLVHFKKTVTISVCREPSIQKSNKFLSLGTNGVDVGRPR